MGGRFAAKGALSCLVNYGYQEGFQYTPAVSNFSHQNSHVSLQDVLEGNLLGKLS